MSKTITLLHPVTIGDRTIAELTIQKPKARHLRGITIGYSGMDMDTILNLAATLTGQLPAVIDELEVDDLAALGAAVIDFLPSGMISAGKAQSA